MARYALKRIVVGFICLLGVSLIISLPCAHGRSHGTAVAGGCHRGGLQKASCGAGLDKPIPVQYFIFIKEAVKGNFGQSVRWKRPAIELVVSRIRQPCN